MESGDKGRYVIFVAVIGALATVSVPLINHWFPAKQQSEAARPELSPVTDASVASKPPATKSGPAPTKAESPIKRLPTATQQKSQPAKELSPRHKLDVAESEALAREYLRSGNWSAAQKELGNLIKLEPSDEKWHGCLANLSLQNGEFAKAEGEFRKSGELGNRNGLIYAARVKAHEIALQKAYDFRPDGEFTDNNWEILQELMTNRIPGASHMIYGLCHGLRIKFDMIQSSVSPSVYSQWKRKEDTCIDYREDDEDMLTECKN